MAVLVVVGDGWWPSFAAPTFSAFWCRPTESTEPGVYWSCKNALYGEHKEFAVIPLEKTRKSMILRSKRRSTAIWWWPEENLKATPICIQSHCLCPCGRRERYQRYQSPAQCQLTGTRWLWSKDEWSSMLRDCQGSRWRTVEFLVEFLPLRQSPNTHFPRHRGPTLMRRPQRQTLWLHCYRSRSHSIFCWQRSSLKRWIENNNTEKFRTTNW